MGSDPVAEATCGRGGRKRRAQRLYLAVGRFGTVLGLLLLVGIVVGRSLIAYRRLARAWRDMAFAQKLKAGLWVPVVRVVGDVAKMFGYPAGMWWRWRHRAQVPDWRRL